MSKKTDIAKILRLRGIVAEFACKREENKLKDKTVRWLKGEAKRLQDLAEATAAITTMRMPDVKTRFASHNDDRYFREDLLQPVE